MSDSLDQRIISRYSGYSFCEDHIYDEDLVNIIRKHGRPYGKCTICGKVEEDWNFQNSFFIEFGAFFEKIKKCVELEYGDAWDILLRDHEEEEFIGSYFYTRELIEELCGDSCDEELVEWIIDAFGETEIWAHRETFSDFDESESLYYSWRSFSDLVKNKVRYLFFDFEEEHKNGISNRPFNILKEIGDYISDQKIFTTYPEIGDLFNQNPKIFRARQHEKADEVKSLKNICSPPPKSAKSNRFSPEGISMFYGAECPTTAIKEVVNDKMGDHYISVAEFVQTRPLQLVDLRNPRLIGFFDEQNIHKRQASFFIKKFVEEITKPIDYETQVDSIEYIPSQIVTEYFRFVLTKKGHRIDGIVYKSSKNQGKDCYVIFADSEACSEEGETKDEHLLFMRKNSIVTKKVKDLIFD